MATQVFALDGGLDANGAWSGIILVDSELTDGGVTAYLRGVSITSGFVVVRLSRTETEAPFTSGPDFSVAVENHDSSFVFAEVGGNSVTVAGPNYSGNTISDPAESYIWQPANDADVNAWESGLGSGAITLTVTDETTSTNQAPTVSITTVDTDVIGDESQAITGSFGDTEDDNADVTVTGTASIGTLSTIVKNNTNGTWSATWTAPSSTSTEQTATITITATDSDGASTDASATIAVAATSLTDPLVLSDFSTTNVDVRPALALLTRGSSPTDAAVWGRGARAVAGSELLDGEIDIPPTEEPINQIRFRDSGNDYGTEKISFHDNGSTHLGTYFSTGDGNDLTLWIQSGTSSSDIAAFSVSANFDRGGSNFAIIDVPSTYQSVLASIDPGDRFIIALTRPSVIDNTAPSISFTTASSTVDGNSATTIIGTVTDAQDNNGEVTVTASTSIGVVSTPVNNNGDWSLTFTSPSVTANQQTATITVTATDSGGLTDTATRVWTVRANQPPTVSITTSPQTVDGSATVALAATATAPETGQSVTIAWTADSGTFTDSTGTSASWVAPSPNLQTIYTITATATDALGLTNTSTVDITVRGVQLVLSDFDDTDLDTTPALALLVRGDASEGSAVWGRGSRAVSGSSLLEGEIDIPPTDEPINQIRFRLDGSGQYGSEQISFHDDGPLSLGTYFESGDGSDLTLWIQTGTGAADIAEIPMSANFDRGGGNFAVIDVPSQYQSIIAGIDPGDRFIIAMTRPDAPANTAPTIEFSTAASIVEGNSVTTIEGTVDDTEDDNASLTVTLQASLGTLSTVIRNGSNWSATLTAPAVAAAQQAMQVTATVTDSGGSTDTATRTWTVRSNQAPTIMITSPSSDRTVDGGTTQNLTATATAPETGQSVSIAWTASGGATVIDGSGVTGRVRMPSSTGSEQTVVVTATATDALGATATDTVTYTVRSISVPDAPATPTVTSTGTTSVSVSWNAPTSGDAPTSYDLRYRIDGSSGVWTEITGVTSPRSISGLTAGTTYEVQVRGANGAGDGVWSSSGTATTDGPPSRPAKPFLSSISEESIQVSWLPPSFVGAGIDSYDIRYRQTGISATWTTLSDVTSPQTITGLSPNIEYEAQVRAVNIDGDGPWSLSGTAITRRIPSFKLGNYFLQADWNRNGQYDHSMSDLFNFMVKMRLHTKRGRDYGTQIFGRSVAGSLSITLRNEGDEFDRFNSNSDLFGYTIIGTSVRLMIEDIDTSGVYHYLWSGSIDKVNFKQKRGGQDEVTFVCKDIITELQLIELSAPARSSVTTESAARILLNAGGISDEKIGNIDGNFTMEHWWSNRQSLLNSMRVLEETEGGFFWVDEENRVNMDSSTNRDSAGSRDPKLTLSDE